MKNFKLLAIALLGLVLWSCKKDETKSTLNTDGASSQLVASATSVVIDKSMIGNTVISFNLTEPNYGYKAAVTNVLQLSTKANNFAPDKTKEFAIDAKSTTKAYSGLDFNNMLLSLNIPTTTNTDVVIRLKSTINEVVSPIYSNVVALSAKPFPLTAWVYLPGAYQGWDPATADSLVSLAGNGVYTGIVVFDGGNFKITPAKKWDIAYGSAGGDKISTTGGDISSVSAGAKMVTVDLNANTIKLEAAKLWSIIGDATVGGWDTDTDLKSLNDGKNTWKITTTLTGGKIMKFRFNHDWGTNLGGNIGALTNGGADISIATTGSYTITLTVNYDPADATKVTGGVATIVKN